MVLLTHTFRVFGPGGVYVLFGTAKGTAEGSFPPIRDRFSHKSVGLIRSLSRTLVVRVVETQESLKA